MISLTNTYVNINNAEGYKAEIFRRREKAPNLLLLWYTINQLIASYTVTQNDWNMNNNTLNYFSIRGGGVGWRITMHVLSKSAHGIWLARVYIHTVCANTSIYRVYCEYLFQVLINKLIKLFQSITEHYNECCVGIFTWENGKTVMGCI